ncbi:MAG: Rha family transcriptional regulator, partial [Bacteroidales bacterium]|nr:Rha family transcriptional regulator [Bacteroidales bacterium]
MKELVFKSEKGNPVTTSLLVAEKFGKRHAVVLETIGNLVTENSAAKFFYKSEYDNRGKQYPMYIMNRDGFSLLVMGFTGAEALKFKIEYINAFNRMEKQLKEFNPANISRLQLLEMALEAERKVIALKPKAD